MKDATALLRIFTDHKIQAAIAAIDQVSSRNHPFKESELALERLRVFLDGFAARVNTKHVSQAVTFSYCKLTLNALEESIPLIGFIERSTEVSGPVEFFGPFSRLVRKILGNDAKLILSSTWRYTPHTIIYPTVIKGLEDFVYVGFCVSESDNAFLTPLAAHELGHNVWHRKQIGAKLKNDISSTLVQLIGVKYKKQFDLVFQSLTGQTNDLISQANWYPAGLWAEQQLQEAFCDFLGLYTFGPSYIYAFAYFLAPGSGMRDKLYPPLHTRYANLVLKAKELSWNVEELPTENIFEKLQRSPETDDHQKTLLLAMADETRELLTDIVAKHAFESVSNTNTLFDPSLTAPLIGQLEAGLPCSESKSLASISDAGWQIIKRTFSEDNVPDWGFSGNDHLRVLNELILKSFEIHEIETALKDNQNA